MKSFSLLAVLAGLTLSTQAIQLVKRDAVPRVLGMEIERREVQNPVKRDQARRRKRQSKTVSETLDNEVCIEQS